MTNEPEETIDKEAEETAIENRVKILKDIFSNVNDWLKFGEAKNALLIGFNGTVIWGAIKIVIDNWEKIIKFDCYLDYYLYSLFTFLSLSILVGLFSFQPLLSRISILLEKVSDKNKFKKEDNYIFFGDLKKVKSSGELLKKIFPELPVEKFTDLETKYSNQIIINSTIAFEKYALFNVALGLTLSAFFTPILVIIIILIEKIFEKRLKAKLQHKLKEK